jgi:hypothetical protein
VATHQSHVGESQSPPCRENESSIEFSNTSGLPWWADQLHASSAENGAVLSHSKLIPNLEALLTTDICLDCDTSERAYRTFASHSPGSLWRSIQEGHDDVILSEFLKGELPLPSDCYL